MDTEQNGDSIFKSGVRRCNCTEISNDPFVFENIFYDGSQVGKGFREGYARSLLDNMVDGVIIFDEEGRIQAFNPVAESIFACSIDDVQMKPVNTLIPKLSPASYVQFMKNGNQKVERDDLGFGGEVTGIRKNGLAVSLNLIISKIDFNGCFLFMATIRKVSL